jgi:hypothetical protein
MLVGVFAAYLLEAARSTKGGRYRKSAKIEFLSV